MGAAEGTFEFYLELKKRSSVATILDKNSYTFKWIPRSREHAQRPLQQIYMDIMSSSVQSIEGYNYALMIAADASMYQLVYGLEEKSAANAAARK